MKINTLIPILAILITTGSLIGAEYLRRQSVFYKEKWLEASLRPPSGPNRPEQPAHRTAAPPMTQTVSQNEAVIAELLAELDAKERLIEQLKQNAEKKPAGESRFPTPDERRQRLESLKTDDPDAYEEIVRRREEMKQRIQDSFALKAAALLERDTSGMSDEELAQYEEMLSLFNRSWELTDALTSEEASREERMTTFQELREVARDLQPMLQDERQRRFEELAVESGYSRDEAAAFADYINKTIQATSPPGGNRGRRTRPPGGSL